MKPQSDLQKKFPLSPRKFWKKMLVVAWKLLLIALFVYIALGPVAFSMGAFLKENILGGLLSIAGSISLTLVVPFCIVLGIYALYVRSYIRRYLYAGEDMYLTIQKGVFTPSEIHVQYQKVQDVYVDQDILDRVFGIYDVHIASATAASGIEAHIDGVDKEAAEGLKRFLFDKFARPQQGGAQPAQTMAAPTPASASAPFSISEKISSVVYPLSGTWVTLQIFTRVIGSLALLALLAIPLSTVVAGFVSLYPVQMLFALVAFAVLVLAFHLIGFFLWKSNYSFDFTPEHIYFKSGVLSISEKHMPYSSIQDVTVRQGILERVFGLASVRIENATAPTVVRVGRGTRTIFPGIIILGVSLADAQKITGILKASVLGKNSAPYGL
ncbi:MAG: PH domain-containing protein [Candidatus Paceibacterota bacterium]|jgi:putative membrane protein